MRPSKLIKTFAAAVGLLLLAAAGWAEPLPFRPGEKLYYEVRWEKVPVARVFDMFRRAQEAGEDYKALMTGPPRMFPTGSSHAKFWTRGYEFDPYTPTFELGITRRIIAVKETLDRVLFVLMDRPEEE